MNLGASFLPALSSRNMTSITSRAPPAQRERVGNSQVELKLLRTWTPLWSSVHLQLDIVSDFFLPLPSLAASTEPLIVIVLVSHSNQSTGLFCHVPVQTPCVVPYCLHNDSVRPATWFSEEKGLLPSSRTLVWFPEYIQWKKRTCSHRESSNLLPQPTSSPQPLSSPP